MIPQIETRGLVLSPWGYCPYVYIMLLIYTMPQIDLCVFSQPFPHFCITVSLTGISRHVVHTFPHHLHLFVLPQPHTLLPDFTSLYFSNSFSLSSFTQNIILSFLDNYNHFWTGHFAFCLLPHLSISQTAATVIFL